MVQEAELRGLPSHAHPEVGHGARRAGRTCSRVPPRYHPRPSWRTVTSLSDKSSEILWPAPRSRLKFVLDFNFITNHFVSSADNIDSQRKNISSKKPENIYLLCWVADHSDLDWFLTVLDHCRRLWL